ncbi:MAG: LysR family transcriptional regulator, partial [Lachnospiraceae bacterium]|nr:LysR family transcriptional regulator [Lachnospiraceae bacterium]
ISRTAAKESLDKQKILEFSFENVEAQRQIHLMFHKDRKLNTASEHTIQALRDFCAKRYGG